MNRGGFMLVEVTIAMFVASITVGIGYTALQHSSSAHQKAVASAQTLNQAIAVRAALRDWISTAQTIADLSEQGGTGINAVLAHMPPYCAAACRVEIGVFQFGCASGVCAKVFEISGNHIATVALDSTASGATVRYAAAGMWKDNWVSTTELPSAVELIIRSNVQGRSGDVARMPLRVRLQP